jgi:putative transposase
VYDASWSLFFQLLGYKALSAGSQVVKVNPNHTSQICSVCSFPVAKDLGSPSDFVKPVG